MKMEKWLEILPDIESILPIAFNHFLECQELPYSIYIELGSANFNADNETYFTDDAIALELYTEHKDLKLQRQLEEVFTEHKIIWDRQESIYLQTEKMYMTVYNLT